MGSQQKILRRRDDVNHLDDFVGYNLKRAYVVFYEDYRETFGTDGVSPRTFSVLSLVIEFPNTTQSELARQLGIERSGLVAIIDELEKSKLIKRTAVPGDRRVQALVPTAAGREAFQAANALVEQHEARLLSGFSDEERASLVHLLQKIRNSETD